MAKNDGSGGCGDGDGGDYDIGYGKPPMHSRWKPGQSGNPRGPKKGSRGLKTDLHNALEARQWVRIKGKVVKGTTQELALYTLATRAASGDIRAIKQLVDVTLLVFGPEDRGRERNILPKQDQELLERLFEEMSSEKEEDTGEDQANQPEDPQSGSNGDDEDGETRDEA